MFFNNKCSDSDLLFGGGSTYQHLYNDADSIPDFSFELDYLTTKPLKMCRGLQINKPPSSLRLADWMKQFKTRKKKKKKPTPLHLLSFVLMERPQKLMFVNTKALESSDTTW